MKKVYIFLMLFISIVALCSFGKKAYAKSYMSDKTEVPVSLEVSGAEALAQTDDGYVWIAQYSGLTRYDANNFVSYNSFFENGESKDLINVRALASKENTLYIATSSNVIVHKDDSFHQLNIETGTIRDIVLDSERDMLYISTESKGAIIYDINNKTSNVAPGTEGKLISDIALNFATGGYFYQSNDGVYDDKGVCVLNYPKVLDIYSFGDILYMGQDDGIIHRYNMKTKQDMPYIVVSDQINRMLYSNEEKILFVACETNGIYCVDLSTDTPQISLAGDLENKSQLVDLMIDYEGNLWVASHYIGASGVSIITKNALLELLYDDPIWQDLPEAPEKNRNIYAVERFDDILYIVADARIYLYDLVEKKILEDNAIMQELDKYKEQKDIEGKLIDEGYDFKFYPKDVEVFNSLVYFAVSGIGLVEYDPTKTTDSIKIYETSYISNPDNQDKLVGNPNVSLANTVRCLRSFDTYLAMGFSRGVMKFDGQKFSIMAQPGNVLYINKSIDGKLMFDRTGGLFEIDDEFSEVKEIPTETGATGNRLKFLVDGNDIYYNLNSRLFRVTKTNDGYLSKEISIPYVKGSIIEIAKIKYIDKTNKTKYKYVIASQNQIYITDTLDVDSVTNYEVYDHTNGLQQIIANTSGYYDEDEQKYYFQSTNGIYVYDFNETRDASIPVKIALSSIELDGIYQYGNQINISKDTSRVVFNLSILGFRPNKGHTIYYKLDGVDSEYNAISDENKSITYTNLAGGEYKFHIYVEDEYGQLSNVIDITLTKDKHIYEQVWFWIIIAIIAISIILALNFLLIKLKTRNSLRRQLQLKNITVEAIQAIARTIDAKDEYTNGHSIRVGYYSKIIAEHLHLSQDEVDNIYYIALLHDIGKIAIPDNILNKPGRLTDEEFAIMKSHTTRGAKILNGISTIPQIIEGAKSHHEKYDGTGYPEGLKGEFIPYVARIICCADCFDAMASKRVYKEPFPLEKIIGEFERCSGTQFDPHIAKVVVDLIKSGKLKPYTAENTYLGADGKTHRMKKEDVDKMNQKEAE